MNESTSPFKRNKVLGQSYTSETFKFGSRLESVRDMKTLRPNLTDSTSPNPLRTSLQAFKTNRRDENQSKVELETLMHVDLMNEIEHKAENVEGELISYQTVNYVSANREDKNTGLHMSILVLKLQLGFLSKQNKVFKEEMAKKKTAEEVYARKLRSLAATYEDLLLTERLDNEKPSELLKSDMDEIDLTLDAIYAKLDTVTGESGQNNYLTQVLSKQKEFYAVADENAALLSKLGDNVFKFRNTILNEEKSSSKE